jgi:hypothetical protein
MEESLLSSRINDEISVPRTHINLLSHGRDVLMTIDELKIRGPSNTVRISLPLFFLLSHGPFRSTSFYFPYLAVPSRAYILILSTRFTSLRSTALRTLIIDWTILMSHDYV